MIEAHDPGVSLDLGCKLARCFSVATENSEILTGMGLLGCPRGSSPRKFADSIPSAARRPLRPEKPLQLERSRHLRSKDPGVRLAKSWARNPAKAATEVADAPRRPPTHVCGT